MLTSVEQIGRYRILDELGRGATGVVYRAQDPAIGRIIAIKTIRLSDFTDETERDRLRERLFREAQSAGILSHPNIVTIYDIAEENGLAYIFMEYVDGPPLEKVLNAPEPLDSSVILSILHQTAVALDYAHKKGIVHRDIKPANILVHEGPIAKITDFGVAKILSQQMTQSGMMMGTPNYMSPEQVQGHAVDGRADQFSLAVIAYEVLTGEKPFIAEQLPSLLYRIVREEPVAPHHLNPSLGFQVEAALKKGLAKSAGDRYASCLEFVDALVAACHQSPGWHPLPRSSAQNLPTMASPVAPPKLASRPSAPPPAPPPPTAPPGPEPPPLFASASLAREDDRTGTNPVVRSLIWMLVGIGLIGLVLFGAQKYVFNRNTEPAVAVTDAPAPARAAQVPDTSATKPSPVGQPKAPQQEAQQAAPASLPETTSPEVPKPEKAQAVEPPAQRSVEPPVTRPVDAPVARPPAPLTTPPSAITPKATAEQSIQILTDPPGAKVTIDANPDRSCKTPCILSLSPGRHALSADLAGYRPYPRVVNVPDDSDIFLQLTKAAGTLSITSNPAGASIEINGEMQTKRTPAMFNFQPGTYHVKVARSGAFLDFDVQIRDGEFVNKRVDF